MATAITLAKQKGLRLLVPTHEVFNPDGKLEFDFRSTVVNKADASTAAVEVAELGDADIAGVIKSYLLAKHPVPGKRKKPHSAELVIYVDNAYDPSVCVAAKYSVPPPLMFYRYIIETRYWPRVTIVAIGGSTNLVFDHLRRFYPKIRVLSGDAPSSWHYILNATNLVIGAELFGQISSLISETLKQVWLPEYAISSGYLSNQRADVFPIKIVDYLEPGEWKASESQLGMLIEHPSDKISDEIRWTFTDTEQCRSFEHCQTCRDMGTAGKLWRRIVADRFDVPHPDWNCPHGWKWGGKPGPGLRLKRILGIGTLIKRTTAVLGISKCTDCLERADKLDGKRV